MDHGRRITVFCASSRSVPESYHRIAEDLGRRIAGAGLELVFGGGSIGLMGTLGRSVLGAGGKVTSVILDRFVNMGINLPGATQTLVVDDLRPRKARMEDLADAFIALPGGFGTFEELLEAITRKQVGFHSKPIVILNHLGFYDPLIRLFDQAAARGFIDGKALRLYRVAESAEEAMEFALDGRPG